MNPSEYVKLAVVTESNNYDEIGQRLSETQNIRLLHAAIGLCTEAGEIQDALKKSVFYGKTLDVVNVKEELGDIMWYVALACDAIGADLGDVMANNIAKLKARFGEKYSHHSALNRDLNTERKILENKATKDEVDLINTVVKNMLTSRYSYADATGHSKFLHDCTEALEHVGIRGALVTLYTYPSQVSVVVSYKNETLQNSKSQVQLLAGQ